MKSEHLCPAVNTGNGGNFLFTCLYFRARSSKLRRASTKTNRRFLRVTLAESSVLAVRLPEKAETSCLHACVFGRARLNCGVLVRKQVEGFCALF